MIKLFSKATDEADAQVEELNRKRRKAEPNPVPKLTKSEMLIIENEYLSKVVTFEKFMECICPAKNPETCKHMPFCDTELDWGAVRE